MAIGSLTPTDARQDDGRGGHPIILSDRLDPVVFNTGTDAGRIAWVSLRAPNPHVAARRSHKSVTNQSTTEVDDIARSTSGSRDPSLAPPVATRAGWSELDVRAVDTARLL